MKDRYRIGIGFGAIADGPSHTVRVRIGTPFAELVAHAGGSVVAEGRLDRTPTHALALAVTFARRSVGAAPRTPGMTADLDAALVLEPGGRPLRWAMLTADASAQLLSAL